MDSGADYGFDPFQLPSFHAVADPIDVVGRVDQLDEALGCFLKKLLSFAILLVSPFS